jgi:hypothetical protein
LQVMLLMLLLLLLLLLWCLTMMCMRRAGVQTYSTQANRHTSWPRQLSAVLVAGHGTRRVHR